MKIAIGNDHAAVGLKREIMAYVKELGHEVENYGTDTEDSCHYPLYGKKVADAVASKAADCGILICGISVAANKVKGIRAAVCSEPVTARLVKEHNNANIIAFGARIVGVEVAKEIVSSYLNAEFLGGRHAERVAMIADLETENFQE